ncbi:MAG: alanine--glyoxylate aminotransferase family protein [Rhodocyclaceae bacterium]|nr:alanine--glyoxylate aminotransferase family protein [Rhodocyclaceae bacterium]MBK6554507.1 alanine--glyoxylate aminotransferase family protein [Rhodocyclaceae bacterium]MBK6677555.1 alanine--glyoxylate aminotransferase family protein [Rhodocyclaceae bacterium]MBK9310213.1 alanine--glyoxylate aminotransferase family protein [Rhodocyclaceae bacterium]MBK9954714.1 alanine--glyoxylate aminotransferase family protein [Rhodocyclaceae bacterium]
MGPGPSDMHPRVVAALGHSAIGHLDPAFVAMMEEIKVLLRYAFQTENALTFAVSGPGSVGMETCFVNLVEPGDKVIVCRNGVFGGRMIENVQRFGGTAVVVEDTWGEPVDPRKVADALKANPDAKMVAFVHAETSTGAQSDAAALVKLAREAGCLSIVDTVTSLGGTPVLADAWGADAIYSGSQKCLSCVPGLAPVTFSERAVERVKARKQKVPSWFMDLGLVLEYWSAPGGKRTYHHTAPVNSLFALHESLVMLKEEGLEQAWARHRLHHEALKAGFDVLGLRFVVREDARLPQLNAVYIPEGVDDAAVRKQLLEKYNLEIGAGLGPLAGKVWRFGLMGHSARRENVDLCLGALADVLSGMGKAADKKTALAAASSVYATSTR